jgi:hypothetical protein
MDTSLDESLVPILMPSRENSAAFGDGKHQTAPEPRKNRHQNAFYSCILDLLWTWLATVSPIFLARANPSEFEEVT